MKKLKSFHVPSSLFVRFPLSKPQLATKWVQSLGMKNFIPTPNTCLCSEHFRTDCFRDYNGKQFLREDAVPTIFTPGQESSKVGAGFLLFLCWKMAFSTWSEQITLHILQIELRKRGVIPKEANVSNQMGTLTDRDRMRETVMRREKRGGMRVSFFWCWFIYL